MLPVEQIDIESLSSHSFDIAESIEMAREVLDELKVQFSFEEDKWVFENHLSGGNINIDFERIQSLEQFTHNKWHSSLKTVIKCWVASLLNDYFPFTVNSYFHYLVTGLNQTHLLNPKKMEAFEIYLTKETNYHPKTIRQILLSLINFVDFYEEIDGDGEYLQALTELKSKFSYESEVRKLPSSKEILMFSSVVSDYFEKNQDWSSYEYIKHSPVYIWWNLTNIIPMRPSEFCLIERASLSQVDGKNYVRIPRKKKPKSNSKRNIQVIDTFHVSSSLFSFINEYIAHSEPFGESDTLISYRASATQSGLPSKKNPKKINLSNLTVMLKNFYKEIVEGQYGLFVNRYLKPNDTRHLAFLNLLMQGVHPVEIARLGGHLSVGSQYHYFRHQEYWVDSEIEKLMLNFQLNQENEKGKTEAFFQDLGLNNIFKALHKPPTHSKVKKKLRIGFCTDELQRCQTDTCFHCDHWRITKEELSIKQLEINEVLKQQRSNIDDLCAFLRNIHSQILKERKELHPILVKEYSDAVNKVKSEVFKYARLAYNIQVGE